jgi:SAM-dependent methyltransferase
MKYPAAPPRRTPEQLRNHYEVERSLAARLKATRTWEERARIFSAMYGDLFTKVPDHPRLTIRTSPEDERVQIERQLALLRGNLTPQTEYVEFGAGTCALAFAVSRLVLRARVVEIADQIPAGIERPRNFELVLYDGHNLDLPAETVDVVFSNQFVEHLHLDDAAWHFSTVHRMLRFGGRYVLTTPERWTGPHDISRGFSETAEGFHLKEWTYGELRELARQTGFRRCTATWIVKGNPLPTSFGAMLAAEALLSKLPVGPRRRIGRYLIPLVVVTLIR